MNVHILSDDNECIIIPVIHCQRRHLCTQFSHQGAYHMTQHVSCSQ